jgi:hypothetical protein
MWGENMFVPFAGKGTQGEPILEDTRKHIFRLDHTAISDLAVLSICNIFILSFMVCLIPFPVTVSKNVSQSEVIVKCHSHHGGTCTRLDES